MKTLKINNEFLFYLFMLNYKNHNEQTCINFNFGEKFTTIRYLNKIFTYFENDKSKPTTKNFNKYFFYFLNSEIIKKSEKIDQYVLTEKGEKILKDNNLNTLQDLNNLLIIIPNIKTSEDDVDFYLNILTCLSRFKKPYVRKYLIREICNHSSMISHLIDDLVLNGCIEITYRNNICSMVRTEKERDNIAKRIFYFDCIKPFNKDSDYYAITNKGRILLEELKLKTFKK